MNENYKNRIANLCKEKSAYMEKMAACDKEKERMKQYVIAALEELKDTMATVKELALKEGIVVFKDEDYRIETKRGLGIITNVEHKGERVWNGLVDSMRFTEGYIEKRIEEVKVLETSVDYWNKNFKSATQIREWIKGMYEAVCATLEKSVSECKGKLESAITNGSKEYEKVIQ